MIKITSRKRKSPIIAAFTNKSVSQKDASGRKTMASAQCEWIQCSDAVFSVLRLVQQAVDDCCGQFIRYNLNVFCL